MFVESFLDHTIRYRVYGQLERLRKARELHKSVLDGCTEHGKVHQAIGTSSIRAEGKHSRREQTTRGGKREKAEAAGSYLKNV